MGQQSDKVLTKMNNGDRVTMCNRGNEVIGKSICGDELFLDVDFPVEVGRISSLALLKEGAFFRAAARQRSRISLSDDLRGIEA